MKKLLIALLLLPSLAWGQEYARMNPYILGSGVAAPAGITLVTSTPAWATASDTHIHCVFGASTTTGDLLLVAMSGGAQNPPAVGAGTFEDDRGNTWVRDISTNGPSLSHAIYSAIAKDAGVVTVTATPAEAAAMVIGCAAFRGIASNTPIDTATAAASSTNSHAGNNITDAAAVIFGMTKYLHNETSTIAPDENWTCVGESESSSYVSSVCYRITTGAGTFDDGWTYGTNNWWGASTASYK